MKNTIIIYVLSAYFGYTSNNNLFNKITIFINLYTILLVLLRGFILIYFT